MEQHQHYQSLQDQAYNALRSKIIYAELKPGTRLSAIGLEKETGIGRTPIRESFVRLREQELVETRPKSGTYVSKISMEHAENACFLREKLERSVLIK
ncbi:GntR family transcriptional regulator, partial [Collinsella aerofaciens]